MRWKLLIITSVAGSMAAGALWSALVAILFGPAAIVARRDWLLPATLLVPLGVGVIAGYFVYRHTARRRKTQAVITVLAVSLLAALAYLAAAQFWPNYLNPRPRVVHVVALLT